MPDYLDWKTSFTTLDIAAYSFQAINKGTLLGEGAPISVQATNASSELFPLLGVEPLLGRVYGSSEEHAKAGVVLISEQLWRRKFSADPRVIGRHVQIDKNSFAIIGVLPQKNAFPVWADVWMPLSLLESQLFSERKYHPLEVIGRLKPGASLQEAEIDVERTGRQLSAGNPATNATIGAFTVSLAEAVTGDVRSSLVTAWIAVGLVLMIACTNLAHLMLARTLNGRRGIAIRLALGASGLSLFRTFLLETGLVSLAGGILGILMAVLALPVLRTLAQGQIPRLDTVAINVPVLLFGILASLLVAILFALPSFVQALRSDLNDTISAANSRGSSAHGSFLSVALTISEVALSFAVLAAAVLLVRSFSLTLQANSGFQAEGVLTIHFPIAGGKQGSPYDVFRNRIAPQLNSIAGVLDVAAVNSVPMSLGGTEHSRYATRFGIAGLPTAPGQFPAAQIRWCTGNYFRVLGIPLRRGRLLAENDRTEPRYLINEAFERQFFPGQQAVGRKILMNVVSPRPETAEIVGVVGDVREFGLTSAPEPTLYMLDVSPEMDILVKARQLSPALLGAVAAIARNVNPEAAVGPVRPLAELIADSLARQRFLLILIIAFAALAVGLCAVGVYGVFSYSVNRRMREFGIRSAIGAQRRDVLLLVLGECLVVIVPGILLGLAISAGFGQLLQSLVYGVSPDDPWSRGCAIISIASLCLLCVSIPALRAARVDPGTILREQ